MDNFSKCFINGLIEFPWALMQTFTFYFFILFNKRLVYDIYHAKSFMILLLSLGMKPLLGIWGMLCLFALLIFSVIWFMPDRGITGSFIDAKYVSVQYSDNPCIKCHECLDNITCNALCYKSCAPKPKSNFITGSFT